MKRSELINEAGQLVRGENLRTLWAICETQKTISTAKLSRQLDVLHSLEIRLAKKLKQVADNGVSDG